MRELPAQVAAVREELSTRPAGLRRHVERVAAEALELARCWNLDPLRTELAVWGHDLFRAVPAPEQLQLARSVGLDPRGADRRMPIVLHGPIAAAVLRERFGVSDADVLEAVARHTLGHRSLSILAKVLLVADKVEAGKRRGEPALASIRRLARRDLDLALLCWADWKWVDERSRGWASHPRHWQARKAWVRAHHREIGSGLR